jgi:NAD(P)-dependent dehydrogenase (short-subunit alcohol dehydrogenase family)
LRERFYFYPQGELSMPKTVLITGASSGFGHDTAETLFRAGHTVYASMRGAHSPAFKLLSTPM